MYGSLANDFDTADNGILLLGVRRKIFFSSSMHIGGNQSGGIQDITQAANLITLHKRRWRIQGSPREPNDSRTFPASGGEQNPQACRLSLQPHRPSRANLPWRRAWI